MSNREIIEAEAPPEELLEQNRAISRRAAPDLLRERAEPIELLPYQVEAVQLLGAAQGKDSRLIGDEMRVGKTPTAIAIDLEAREVIPRKQRGNNCTLIVCPKSVLGVWEEMLLRMGVEHNNIHVVDLPGKVMLDEMLDAIHHAKQLKDALPQYVIVNYSTVVLRERLLVRAGPWFHVIGDEIHEIKDNEGRKAKCFKRIKCKQKTALSGTWVDDKAQDAFSPLNWLWPNVYTSFWAFARTYLTTRVNKKTGFEYIDGVNFPALRGLHKRLEGHYIRRRFVDIAEFVPRIRRQTITLEMGARQRREYDTLRKTSMVELETSEMGTDWLLTPSQVEQMTRWQQLAIGVCKLDADGVPYITDSPKSPKITYCIDWLKDNPDESLVIFAQFRATVERVQARCESEGIEAVSITGTSSIEERNRAIREFQSGSKRVLVGTIRACRQGIDLSRSRTIIYIDTDWNPSVMEQADSRINNVNVSSPGLIIKLESRDSVDQYRADRVSEKGAGVHAVMGTRTKQ